MLADVGTGRQLRMLVTGEEPPQEVERDYEWGGLLLAPYFVSSLAFSADGHRLVSVGSRSQSLQLWDSITGQRLASTLTEEQAVKLNQLWDGEITSPAPQSRRLADLTEQQELFSQFFSSVVLSPDGRWLAALRAGPARKEGAPPATPIEKGPAFGLGTQLVLYDAATLHEVRSLSDFSDIPRLLSFSADARQLAAIGQLSGPDTTLKVWDTSTGQPLRTLPLYHDRRVGATALSNDWHWLATVPEEEMTSIDLWEVSTGRRARTLAGLPIRWLQGNAPPSQTQGVAPDYPPSQSQLSLAREFVKQADALVQKGDRNGAILQ